MISSSQFIMEGFNKTIKHNKISFLYKAAPILNRVRKIDSDATHCHFKEIFGISAYITSIVWYLLSTKADLDNNILPIHLLWTLVFMRHYMTNRVLATFLKANSKTICIYLFQVFCGIHKLANIMVSFHVC